jgi:hypothetical protein
MPGVRPRRTAGVANSWPARGSDAEWDDLRRWRSVRAVRASRQRRCRLAYGDVVRNRFNRRGRVDALRRARHDGRGRHGQLMARVTRAERCRLRSARSVMTVGLARVGCLMRRRACPVAGECTDRRAGERESQQQRDETHGSILSQAAGSHTHKWHQNRTGIRNDSMSSTFQPPPTAALCQPSVR